MSEITPELQAKIPEYRDRFGARIFNGDGYKQFDLESNIKYIEEIYRYCAFDRPKWVLAVENPLELQICSSSLLKNPKIFEKYNCTPYQAIPENISKQIIADLVKSVPKQLEYINQFLFVTSPYSAGYYAWYTFIRDELKVDPGETKQALDNFAALYMESQIFSAIYFDQACLFSKMPRRIYLNDNKDLHNTLGSSMDWEKTVPETDFKLYFINGRQLPAWIWEKAADGTMTADDFIGATNEEHRAGIFQVLGDKKLMELLDAKLIDSGTITHTNGDIEHLDLYKTNKKVAGAHPNGLLAWVKMTCPSTGTNYMIPVPGDVQTAVEAAVATSAFPEKIRSGKEYRFTDRT